ncbi:lysylphosphatidylglycerol synthase transmembrane domain-containing protein [Conexibacter sp. DBS9H8]|uniref:lysylphosphatidylglycerol synthase transmembrane domain-containing protein n=1 Tax=Conexibacter sp. DBS9H8 TaxID=2937801 RepID=UPI00200BC4B3|nr:lysylphosphatidylglycerol synthase transmembrane domain-containing protein [Conexibacter sp. DBS9H8]
MPVDEAREPVTEEAPRIVLTRRRLLGTGVFVLVVLAFLYFALPKLVGLGATFKRLGQGNVWWLVVAVILEVFSYVGYTALFRAVFVHRAARINWRASYQISLASGVATRLFSSGGAGGVALTVWALRRAGVEARTLAARMIAFLVILYGVYMGTLLIDGLGLYFHVWPGAGPFAITVIPALFGAFAIVVFLAVALIPTDLERFVARRAGGTGRIGSIARRLATVPASAAAGVRTAIGLVRRRDPSLLGALANWGFDIACLWASFHAFGYHPHTAVVIMAYFVGWLANLLPIPGGVGGVEGGLIGSFSAFGVSVQGAVVAVLAYRAISFWMPTIPGLIAYLQLRRTVRDWDDATLSEV